MKDSSLFYGGKMRREGEKIKWMEVKGSESVKKREKLEGKRKKWRSK